MIDIQREHVNIGASASLSISHPITTVHIDYCAAQYIIVCATTHLVLPDFSAAFSRNGQASSAPNQPLLGGESRSNPGPRIAPSQREDNVIFCDMIDMLVESVINIRIASVYLERSNYHIVT